MNYKDTLRSINFGGVVTPLPEKAVIVVLTEQTQRSTAADAMQLNSSVYSVTSGKTFRCLGIHLVSDNNGGPGDVVISSGDTEDAETSTITTVQIPTTVARVVINTAIDFELLSGKFLTINPSTARVDFIYMVGYKI